MQPIPTVTIITDNGPLIINKADYDANPDGYTLAAVQVGPVPLDRVVDLNNLTIVHDGEKFFVAGHNRTKVENVPGINSNGYARQTDAVDAIQAFYRLQLRHQLAIAQRYR